MNTVIIGYPMRNGQRPPSVDEQDEIGYDVDNFMRAHCQNNHPTVLGTVAKSSPPNSWVSDGCNDKVCNVRVPVLFRLGR